MSAWPSGTDDQILRGLRIALRQYSHYGKNAANEPEYRTSLIAWLREALGRLEDQHNG